MLTIPCDGSCLVKRDLKQVANGGGNSKHHVSQARLPRGVTPRVTGKGMGTGSEILCIQTQSGRKARYCGGWQGFTLVWLEDREQVGQAERSLYVPVSGLNWEWEGF